MSVSQNSAIVIDYTWENRGDLAWSDAWMQYKWSSMTVRDHSLSAAETLKTASTLANTARVSKSDAFGVVDSAAKFATAARTEAFVIGDGESIVRRVLKSCATSLLVSESIAKRSSVEIELEAFAISSLNAKSIQPNYAIALKVAESIGKRVTHIEDGEEFATAGSTANFPHLRTPNQTFAIKEDRQEKAVSQNLARTLAIDEAKGVSIDKPMSVESFGIKGYVANAPSLHKKSNLSIVEQRQEKSFWQNLERTINVAETRSMLCDQQILEDTFEIWDLAANDMRLQKLNSLRVTDSTKSSVTAIVMQELKVEDERSVALSQELQDYLAVADLVTKVVKASRQEVAIRIADSIRKGVYSSLADAIGINDLNRCVFWVESALDEAVSVKGQVSKRAESKIKSDFAVIEMGQSKSASKSINTDIAIAELFDRTASFIRSFNEATNVQDGIAKRPTKAAASRLKLLERLVMPADMVIADITAAEIGRDRDYSHDDFISAVDRVPMPGWTQWRNFLHGEYEYSKAVFRVVMDAVSADRALIEECEIAVDVPDVIDRGSARIADAQASTGIYVEFNREYHVIPEVTLTARGGVSGGNPVAAELVGSPTLLGFTARLRDTVTGAYMGGTFTWASIGY